MDIRKFDSRTNAEKGMRCYLEQPTEKNKEGAGLILYGADSSFCKEIEAEQLRRNRERRSPLSQEEVENQVRERLAACTKGSFGLTDEGKPFEVKPETAAEFYKEFPEYAERAANFIFARANFFPTALTN